MIVDRMHKDNSITPEVHTRLFQHNEKYIKKNKKIQEEASKQERKVTKEE